MEINFGIAQLPASQINVVGKKIVDVKWRSDEMINGHILLAGGSGTGKTHNIRKIIREIVNSSRHQVRVHIFDVHDDIEIAGDSGVIFSESTSYGLNPLNIDEDIHTGGVRKAIQNFINTINKTSRKLGDRQEAVLRSLMEDLYSANGFNADDPKTWRINDGIQRKYQKKCPNVDDLARFASFRYKKMFVGGDSRSAVALEKLNKETVKMQNLIKEGNADATEKLESLKEKAIESYTDFVSGIKTGREIDELLKFDSKTTLKSVLDRIENLKNGGIFKNTPPNFDENTPVWRYRIKNLGSEEKKMFLYFRLRELYLNALKRGVQDEIVEVIVIDEANKFMDADPDNIISIMANEIRKFGTALVCASQAFTHFTDDFISSVATKMVIGIDEMYWEKTCRQLQIKKEHLEWVKPRETALIQLKRNSSDPNDKTDKIKWFFTKLSP